MGRATGGASVERARSGQGEAESNSYGGWFDATPTDPRVKNFGHLHEAGKANNQGWAVGKIGQSHSTAYGSWYEAAPDTKVTQTLSQQKNDTWVHGHAPQRQQMYTDPPWALSLDKTVPTKKPPMVDQHWATEPYFKTRQQGLKMTPQQLKGNEIALYNFHVAKRETPGELEPHQMTHFVNGTMNMQELDSDDHVKHGCKNSGDVSRDHFIGGRIVMDDVPENEIKHDGKRLVRGKHDIDHFGQTSGMLLQSSADHVSRDGVKHVEGKHATEDHFAMSGLTMGEDAGDGFGGILQDARRGAVKGHENKTWDHFSSAVGLSEDVLDAGLMSAGGVMLGGGTGKESAKDKTWDHFNKEGFGMMYGGEELTASDGTEMTHVAHSKDKTKSGTYDHFAGGSMDMTDAGTTTHLISLGGVELKGTKHGAHHKGEDHFTSMDLNDDADSGLLSAAGGLKMTHYHHDPHRQASTDHFDGGGMDMDQTVEAVMLSSGGAVLRGVGHTSEHGAAEHSFDHFGGGMDLSHMDPSIPDASGLGRGLKHVGSHHASEDHFQGMGLNAQSDSGLLSASGAHLTHFKKQAHSKSEDHFTNGFAIAAGHGHISKADAAALARKEKHLGSVWT